LVQIVYFSSTNDDYARTMNQKGFQGLKKLITTPFPFPLVQMTRTFLFIWVFTLPTVICYSQDMNRKPYDEALLIFFITYGFIGLEYVAMELDDPFGEDPNDFDDLGMAQVRLLFGLLLFVRVFSLY
jgi:predicted membrane chloride channel (bestrophin family)